MRCNIDDSFCSLTIIIFYMFISGFCCDAGNNLTYDLCICLCFSGLGVMLDVIWPQYDMCFFRFGCNVGWYLTSIWFLLRFGVILDDIWSLYDIFFQHRVWCWWLYLTSIWCFYRFGCDVGWYLTFIWFFFRFGCDVGDDIWPLYDMFFQGWVWWW